MNSLGGEWRLDAQVGNDGLLFTEFYQPLVPGQYLFIAPRAQVVRGPADIYGGPQGDDLAARYNVSIATVGLDLGSQFTKYGELRVGLFTGKFDADLQIGDPLLSQYTLKRDIGAALAKEGGPATLTNVRREHDSLGERDVHLAGDGPQTFDEFQRTRGLVAENFGEGGPAIAVVADVLVPGTPYEQVLRTYHRRSPHLQARQDEDSYVANRLSVHNHQPLHDHEFERDGQWYLACDRRIDTGGFVGLRINITERKQAQAQALRLTHFDPLTGLANRTSFTNALSQQLRGQARGRLAVVLADLARFKTVNDSLGHAQDDRLLQSWNCGCDCAVLHWAPLDRLVLQ